MIILSIDSSSKVATAALLNNDEVLGEYVLNNKREHSVLLMPMIENLLKDCNLTINDVDGYVVSKGPGSFTGLRIGMATIKGLSFGSSKPYISISTLDALAYSSINFNGLICPIMDALRENVYTGLYKNNNGELENILEPTLFLGRVNLVYPHHREYYLFVVSHNGNLSFWLSDAAGAISAVHLAVNNIVEF